MLRPRRQLSLLAILALLLAGIHLASPAMARTFGFEPSQQRQASVPSASVPFGAEEARPNQVEQVAEVTSAPAAETVPAVTVPDGTPIHGAAPPPTFMVLGGGTIVSPERFYSPTLGTTSWYQVILPPGYLFSTERYPVLYMLHGAAGGANEWVEIGIHTAADRLWAAGSLRPYIIVLPEGGQSSYYINHANGGPRWADYLVQDVVTHIDANYRTLSDPQFRAIGGLSMGGEGALQLAMNNRQVFGIVGAHSPTTRQSYDQIPGPIYGDQDYFERRNGLWLIRNTGLAEGLKISIDVGELDPWVFSAYTLHEALNEKGIDHLFKVNPGYHDAEYWIANVGEYLHYYGQVFPAETQLARRGIEGAAE